MRTINSYLFHETRGYDIKGACDWIWWKKKRKKKHKIHMQCWFGWSFFPSSNETSHLHEIQTGEETKSKYILHRQQSFRMISKLQNYTVFNLVECHTLSCWIGKGPLSFWNRTMWHKVHLSTIVLHSFLLLIWFMKLMYFASPKKTSIRNLQHKSNNCKWINSHYIHSSYPQKKTIQYILTSSAH